MSLGVYRQIAYAGLAMWGALLLEFVLWRITRRYALKKPMTITVELDEEGKAAFLARKREALENVTKQVKRASRGIGISIMVLSLWILISGILGMVVSKSFILKSLILTCFLIPLYCANLAVLSIFKDGLRQLEKGQTIYKPAAWPAAAQFLPWFNLIPLLAALPLFYLIPGPELAAKLGFGLGVLIVMALLAVVFIRAGAAVGVLVNLILLNFVWASYLLPGFAGAPGASPESAAAFVTLLIMPLLAVGSVAGLVVWVLTKQRGVFVSPQSDRLFHAYTRLPFQVSSLGALVALAAKYDKTLDSSIAFVFLQALAWLILLISLLVKEFRGRLDFLEVRDYIIKEKGLKIKIGRATLLVNLGLFLAAGTFFESFRGLWVLWAGASLWLLLILASLWKVWHYAFEDFQES